MKTVAVVMVGSLLSALDQSIINSAMNDVSRTFNASGALIQWMSAAYMLAGTLAGLIAGWTADRFGAKRVYMSSLAIFLAASAMFSASWSGGSIVTLRFLQGLSGGMIVPIGMGILAREAGPRRIGWAMGALGASMLLGTIAGPILGGFLVDHFSWRSTFTLNLLLGLTGLAAAHGHLEAETPKQIHGPDWKGILLLSSGLAVLVYSLSLPHNAYSNHETVVGILVALALLIQFVRHARNHHQALIDVRLFVGRTVGVAATTTFFLGIVFFGLALVVPLYLQIVRSQSSLDAGLLLAAQSLGTIITTPIAGRLSDIIAPGKVILAGLVLMSAGTLGLSLSTIATPLWQIELILFVTGAGVGSTPTMSAALRTLRDDQISRVAGAFNALLRVGGLFGTALAMSLLAPGLSQVGPANVMDFSADGVQHAAMSSLFKLQSAFDHTFLWSFGFVLAAIVSTLFLPTGRTMVSIAPVNVNRVAVLLRHDDDTRQNSRP